MLASLLQANTICIKNLRFKDREKLVSRTNCKSVLVKISANWKTRLYFDLTRYTKNHSNNFSVRLHNKNIWTEMFRVQMTMPKNN